MGLYAFTDTEDGYSPFCLKVKLASANYDQTLLYSTLTNDEIYKRREKYDDS